MKKFIVVSAFSMLISMAPYTISANTNTLVVPSVALAQENSAAQITADGYGVFPAGRPIAQAKMMARRAVIMDAQRNLL